MNPLTFLFTCFLLVASGAAFAPPSCRFKRELLIVAMSDAPQKEEVIRTVSADDNHKASVDEKIKQDFESHENSPAKIDSASRGKVQSSFDEIDETKVFDPTTLWTDHSSKF
jgi:hypothetical protein